MLRFAEWLSYCADRLSRFVMVFLFILCFVGTVYQVISRYLLESIPALNFPWLEEGARYCFIWITFLGIGAVYKRGGHAQVEILRHYLPARFQRPVRFVVEIINALFFIILLEKGVQMLLITKGQLSPSLHLDMSWMYASILTCSLICLFHCFFFILQGLNGVVGKEVHTNEKTDARKAANH